MMQYGAESSRGSEWSTGRSTGAEWSTERSAVRVAAVRVGAEMQYGGAEYGRSSERSRLGFLPRSDVFACVGLLPRCMVAITIRRHGHGRIMVRVSSSRFVPMFLLAVAALLVGNIVASRLIRYRGQYKMGGGTVCEVWMGKDGLEKMGGGTVR